MATEKPGKSDSLTISKAYLILYNFILFLGWTALFLVMTMHFITEETHKGVYAATSTLLNIFQTAAILEVIHAAVGLVRSNPVLTGFQVASRVFLTWGIVYSVKETQSSIGVPVFLFAWSVTEMIRYSFYTLGLVGNIPYFLSWCRYTFFIVLYPIGVTGELLAIYAALPHAQRSGVYSLRLPNTVNWAFDYYYFLIIVMISYIPIFPQLYLHMFGQRKKVLGGPRPKKE